jgi:hypothetical protein
MDFDEFSVRHERLLCSESKYGMGVADYHSQQEASCIPDVSGSERRGISEILSKIRRKHVKAIPTASGKSVQHMEPSCMQHILKPETSPKGQAMATRAVTWICLPYFSLENYSGLASSKSQTGFPIQTLLQTKISRATRERDLQQAVCQIKETANGHCFHIAQFWCLVLDNCRAFLNRSHCNE